MYAVDSKQELEELARSVGSPTPPPLPPPLPQLLPQKRQPKNTKKKAAALDVEPSQSKKAKQSNETKNKKAQATATDAMADAILSHMATECTKCKAKDEKIAELCSSIDDMKAAIVAKKAQIRQLESQAIPVTSIPQTSLL